MIQLEGCILRHHGIALRNVPSATRIHAYRLNKSPKALRGWRTHAIKWCRTSLRIIQNGCPAIIGFWGCVCGFSVKCTLPHFSGCSRKTRSRGHSLCAQYIKTTFTGASCVPACSGAPPGFARRAPPKEEGDYSDAKFDAFSGFSENLFGKSTYDEEDNEADRVFAAIEDHVDSKRKRRRCVSCYSSKPFEYTWDDFLFAPFPKNLDSVITSKYKFPNFRLRYMFMSSEVHFFWDAVRVMDLNL